MEIVRKRKDFKSLSKVSARAELQDIYLLSCNVSRTIDALSFDQVGAEINFAGSLLAEDDEFFTAQVNLTVLGHPKDDVDDVVINIDAAYNLVYRLGDKQSLTSDDLVTFCEMNAVYNIWPFFRELVQNMANRMDIPSLMLPLFKIRPEKLKKQETPVPEGKKEAT